MISQWLLALFLLGNHCLLILQRLIVLVEKKQHIFSSFCFLSFSSLFPFSCTKWHMVTLPTQQNRRIFVCLLYFPQGNILYWSRNLMSNNSFKTAHLTSASQAIFCLFICMSFKHHDHRGLCYYCQCLGKEMKTEVTWLLNGRKLF